MDEQIQAKDLNKSALKDFWYPVCQSHQLKNKPLARMLFSLPLVLFRNEAGRALAFFDLCPHRNAPLSAGKITKKGLLECPYHGWRFNSLGACVMIPGYHQSQQQTMAQLISYETIEQRDLVWVRLCSGSHASKTPYYLPDYEAAGVVNGCNEELIEANFKEVLDNFVDSMHPHFVHKGIMYDDKKRQKLNVKVGTIYKLYAEKEIIGLEALFENERINMGSNIFNMIAPKDPVEHYERYFKPLIHQAEYNYKNKIKVIVTFILSPETESTTRVFSKYTIKSRLPKLLTKFLLKKVLVKLLKQDKQILKMQTEAIKKAGKKTFFYTPADLLPLYTKRFLSFLENGIPLDSIECQSKDYEVFL